MRRIICLLLVLLLCMSLPMAAFAAGSVAQSGTPVVTFGSNPKTGDMAQMELWVPILIASALALVAMVVVYFKKFRKAN